MRRKLQRKMTENLTEVESEEILRAKCRFFFPSESSDHVFGYGKKKKTSRKSFFQS